MEVRVERQSVQIRAKLLGDYEKRINHLSQHLGRAKGLAPEAKKEIESRIKLLKKRKRRLEDRYKEIDDLREEAAQLKESAREIRALLPTSESKSPTKHRG
jgi:dsDNA-specific endonuclease/ATPase MutS2